VTTVMQEVCTVNRGAAIQHAADIRKPGDGVEGHAEQLRVVVGEVLDQAELLGTPRKAVAHRMSVSLSTVYSFSRAGQRMQMTAANLWALLCCPVLPRACRETLWDKLSAAAGMLAMPVPAAEGKADTAPVPVQVCEVAAAAGKLAEVATRLRGGSMTAEQAEAMMVAVREVQREAAELGAAVAEMAGEEKRAKRKDEREGRDGKAGQK
jgi:hypothetical protein